MQSNTMQVGIDRIRTVPNVTFLFRAGCYLAVNPLNGLSSIIDRESYLLLQAASDSLSLVAARYQGFSEAIVERMLAAGLVTLNGNEPDSPPFGELNQRRRLSLVILHTTNACNFRCRYCYHDSGCGPQMPPEVAFAALEKLQEHHDHNIVVEFHGGEPLLCKDLIRATVEYGNTFRLSDGRRKFSYAIQTNASLVDEETAYFLRAHGFIVGVSLDGPALFNDVKRVFPDGGGTYGAIMKGVKTLQNAQIEMGVIVVVWDPSVLDHLIEFMLDTGIRSVQINPYHIGGRAKERMRVQDEQEEFALRTVDLIDQMIEYNKNHHDNRLNLANATQIAANLVGVKRNFMCRRCPCGAAAAMLAIDTDGGIYPCEEMCGHIELCLGNVFNDSVSCAKSSPLALVLGKRRASDFAGCQHCEWRNVCCVNCPSETLFDGGRLLNRLGMCTYNKVLFREIAWRLHSDPGGILNLVA
jgi:uncharacterized protein